MVTTRDATMTGLQAVRAIFLDLDDTLYAEHDFFVSGLGAMANWMGQGDTQRIAQFLVQLNGDVAINGRQGVIDRISLPPEISPDMADTWRLTLLHIYRTHKPTLRAFDDVAPFMLRARKLGYRLALVTDGKSRVQWNKLTSLGLEQQCDAIIATDDIDAPKPSIRPFLLASQLVGVAPANCVYIADDSSKDFLGPHRLGMASMQLTRGLAWPLARPAQTGQQAAQYHIASLANAATLLFGEK
jgi:putative hydrolase of the HAD superfamily